MSKSQKIVSGLTHVDLGWKKTAEEMEEIFENFIIKLLDVCSCYPEFTHMLEQAYNYRRLKDLRRIICAQHADRQTLHKGQFRR